MVDVMNQELNEELLEGISGGVKVSKKECNGNVYENVHGASGKEVYSVYVVVSGDTLSGIAAAFGLRVTDLQRLNQTIIPTVNNTTLANPNLIRPGNQIIVAVK